MCPCHSQNLPHLPEKNTYREGLRVYAAFNQADAGCESFFVKPGIEELRHIKEGYTAARFRWLCVCVDQGGANSVLLRVSSAAEIRSASRVDIFTVQR